MPLSPYNPIQIRQSQRPSFNQEFPPNPLRIVIFFINVSAPSIQVRVSRQGTLIDFAIQVGSHFNRDPIHNTSVGEEFTFNPACKLRYPLSPSRPIRSYKFRPYFGPDWNCYSTPSQSRLQFSIQLHSFPVVPVSRSPIPRTIRFYRSRVYDISMGARDVCGLRIVQYTVYLVTVQGCKA